jgi:hypothetical protein
MQAQLIFGSIDAAEWGIFCLSPEKVLAAYSKTGFDE